MIATVPDEVLARLTRETCSHGHDLRQYGRLNKGYVGCRMCDRLSSLERRKGPSGRLRAIPPKAAAHPVLVPWHVYQMTDAEMRYSPGEKLHLLRRWFCRLMGHSPSVLRCSPTVAAELRAYVESNPAVAARWEDCTILGDELAEDDGWVGLR